MKNYERFELAQKNLVDARDWLENRNRVDSQDHGNYKLCNVTFSAEYCGQRYAGANNYHESPKVFNEYMVKAIMKNFYTLTAEAIDIMEKDLNLKLVACEEEVKRIQERINQVKEL